MKKLLKTFLSCLVIVPCLFLLFACNDPQNSNLTKAQYAEALGAVENSLSGSSTQGSRNANQLMLAPAGYIETTDGDDTARGLIKFIKLIMNNNTYELTSQTIEYSMIVPDGNTNPTARFRQRIDFDGSNINGFLAFAIPNFDNATTSEDGAEQAILFNINYDFDTKTLISYKIDSYAYMSELDEGYKHNYRSILLEDGKLFRPDGYYEDYESIKQNIASRYLQEKSKTPITKDYDFSDELAQAHS